jgi:hypothetical protein
MPDLLRAGNQRHDRTVRAHLLRNLPINVAQNQSFLPHVSPSCHSRNNSQEPNGERCAGVARDSSEAKSDGAAWNAFPWAEPAVP